jgi:hypothetical protein
VFAAGRSRPPSWAEVVQCSGMADSISSGVSDRMDLLETSQGRRDKVEGPKGLEVTQVWMWMWKVQVWSVLWRRQERPSQPATARGQRTSSCLVEGALRQLLPTLQSLAAKYSI